MAGQTQKAQPKPQQRLSQQQIDFVCFIEQRFWETGSIPTVQKISEELCLAEGTIKNYWENPTVRDVLVSRGVDLLDKSTDLLTAQQLYLANALLNIHDKRSVREKCKESGVSTQQYNAWMRTSAFQGYMRRRAEAMYAGADSDAYLGLVNAVRSGDRESIKFFFEMRGIYNPKMQVDINVNVMLSQVVEIIQRHVTDSRTLMAIAADFEELETGVRPEVPEVVEAVSTRSLPVGEVEPAIYDL